MVGLIGLMFLGLLENLELLSTPGILFSRMENLENLKLFLEFVILILSISSVYCFHLLQENVEVLIAPENHQEYLPGNILEFQYTQP